MSERLKLTVLLAPAELDELRRQAALGERSVSAEARLRLRSTFVLQAGALTGREQALETDGMMGRSAGAPTSPAPRPVNAPSKTPAQVAASVPGVTTGAALKAGRNVEGAAPGMCAHRVKLDSFCKRCAEGQ